MDPGQPFWRAIWTYLIKLNTSICYSPSALPGHIFPQEIPTQKPKMICAKSLQSCPTLFDPIDGSPPGSPVPGILQARTLEWVAISFSNAWKWKVKVKLLSRVWLWATHGLQPTMLFLPWGFPGKSTGVGCHCLLYFVITHILKSREPSLAMVREGDVVMEKGTERCYIADFEDGRGGHKSRNAAILRRWKRQENGSSLRNSARKNKPCRPFVILLL